MNLFTHSDGRVRVGWRVLLGVLVAIAAQMIAGALTASFRGGGGELAAWSLTLVLLIGGFSLLETFADKTTESPLAAQGLPRRHWVRHSLLGFLIGAGLISVGVGIMAVLGEVSLQRVSGAEGGRVLSVLLLLAAAAMTEEVMFRGYPFQRLVEALGPVPAILVLSALFGIAHARNPHVSALALANTLLVGVLLAFAYLRTRALWLPWGIHFAWNTVLGVGFGLPVSGLSFAVLVQGTASGPAWVTGGDYGLEASLLATAVILLGFVPVLMLPKSLPAPAETGIPQVTLSDTGHPTA